MKKILLASGGIATILLAGCGSDARTATPVGLKEANLARIDFSNKISAIPRDQRAAYIKQHPDEFKAAVVPPHIVPPHADAAGR